MIELRTLTKEERTKILIQCGSSYLSYNKTKTVQSIFSEISKTLPICNQSKELKVIITITGNALKRGYTGSLISLDNRNYVTANRVTKQALNQKRMHEILDILEEFGYIDWYLGSKSKIENDSYMSCFIIKDKLKCLYPDKVLSTFSSSLKVNEVVEIKDIEGNVITKTTRFKGISDHRNLMLDYNACLKRHCISIGDTKYVVEYKQVFYLDLTGAGRIYTAGGFQTMKSTTRCDIKLDGERTVEGDITSNHLSIMYSLEGIRLDDDFDCYSLDSFDYEYSDMRKLCKLAVMCMINCGSKTGSYLALRNILEEDRESNSPELLMFPVDLDFCKDVISGLCLKHSRLKFFDKNVTLWSQLQRLDSRVCEGVIQHFTKIDVPVLCWHDSWVVPCRYKDKLESIIKESWFKVLGNIDNCKVKFK